VITAGVVSFIWQFILEICVVLGRNMYVSPHTGKFSLLVPAVPLPEPIPSSSVSFFGSVVWDKFLVPKLAICKHRYS